MNIILASSSAYRKKLLSQLFSSLTCIAPEINESIHNGESATNYVSRLSLEKAIAVSKKISDALIIGSDQCAELDGKIISKPVDHADAFNQLSAASGKCVIFYTGLCLLNTNSNTHQLCCEKFQVQFRNLTKVQIEAYLKKDEPYDCAGSFKSESLGIALCEKMQGNDPNILIGLPMIKLVTMLHNEGVDVLTHHICN